MLKFKILAYSSILLVVPTAARADFLVYQAQIGPANVNYPTRTVGSNINSLSSDIVNYNVASSTITFPKFDSSLGTLTGVEFQIDGTAASAYANQVLSFGTIFNTLGFNGNLTQTYGVSSFPGLSLLTTSTVNNGSNTLTASVQSATIQMPAVTNSSAYVAVAPSSLSTYIGSGTVSGVWTLSTRTEATTSNGGVIYNMASSLLSNVRQRYTFTPTPVPEPASIVAIGVGLGCLLRRRKQ